MTSVHPPVAGGAGPADAVRRRPGLASAGRSPPTGHPQPVAGGAARAVARASAARWTCSRSTRCAGPVALPRPARRRHAAARPGHGPQHTLVGRPLEGCALHRIELRELFMTGYEQQPGYGDRRDTAPRARTATGRRTPTRRRRRARAGAAVRWRTRSRCGIGRGLGVLFDAPVDGRPVPGAEPDAESGAEPDGAPDAAGARADDGILWMPVAPGSVRYGEPAAGPYPGADGDPYGARGPVLDLLVDGDMWRRMVDQQTRLLLALDRWIGRLERAHEDRAAAGIKAGEEVPRAPTNAAGLHRRTGDRARAGSGGRRAGRATTARSPRAGWSRGGRDRAAGRPWTPARRRTVRPRGRAVRGRRAAAHPRGLAQRPLVAGGLRPAGRQPGRQRRAGRPAVAARRIRGGDPGNRPPRAGRPGPRRPNSPRAP